MKRKTAALYDPYLDVMGGGERHILSILQVLDQEGYDINLFWDKDLTAEIQNKLNLRFENLKFQPNIFSFPSPMQKLQKLASYDLFFYVTDGSYFFSSARKNFVFCMVPDRKLYSGSMTNKLKTLNYRFISNSVYTKKWLSEWGIKSDVIYPYIAPEFLDTDLEKIKKEKLILAVGRFFPHLHAKKQNILMEAFAKFREKHPDFKLVLAGGLKKEDEAYFNELEKEAAKLKNIVLKPNIPYPELVRLYRSAMFFWHFAGYGVNEEEHPDQVEHLGMTPLEGMASGAVPFCYRAGGPKEIIKDGENGHLFLTRDELLEKTERLLADPATYGKMQKAGKETVSRQFSFAFFRKNAITTLLK